MIEETVISRAIIESYLHDLLDSIQSDVIIGGAGPSGLCASYYLAKKGHKVVLFERALKLGGGMPGGGIMFNRIVVQETARRILDEFAIRYEEYKPGYYVANSLEATAALTDKAIKAGAKIFNLITIEDVVVREQVVSGVVINWSSVEMAKLHIDPISFESKFVIDATGHPSEIARIVERKNSGTLLTPSGKIEGEKSMWAEVAEQFTVENTKEIFPNLYVCGMAANAVFGGPRMGPIFGGMLISGMKVAELVMKKI
ncbi:ribulose-1,5-biphosphate synthetase [candidate division WOR_3 bacterium SM1_77]|jgi:thiazole biosynthesis enzyme|uniref:Thiamine thiazole synthase n=1 Tax=candidate division WOR_3 bacterium SM1_77 TaxID=1703778 RepID=A0A0S8JWQ9_UNCW3|nr:MAG: ribulose-1,5-biphosphate synthetase [candidate division WOR_3 bacterium SM1_77]